MCSHQEGLAEDSTLEELSLHDVPSDDDGAVSARNALSFRTNSTLKSLTVSFAPTQEKIICCSLRLEVVK
jgi:hypothetical protein